MTLEQFKQFLSDNGVLDRFERNIKNSLWPFTHVTLSDLFSVIDNNENLITSSFSWVLDDEDYWLDINTKFQEYLKQIEK